MSNRNAVFVLNPDKTPCNPVHPAVARKLLSEQKAAVFRRYPFTIILKEQKSDNPSSLRLKIDPGSRYTGLALVSDKAIVWVAELEHRGLRIKDALQSRRQLRSGRRSRKTRYRKPRFLNRTRPKGWLPPSLMSRVYNIKTWVDRLCKLAPVKAISQELVRFDMQKMENPEISGVEYQQGELQGYEVREYLLEKWQRKCVYCNAENVPLQVEHIKPKAKGGTNRVSNLTLACQCCNQKKGTQDINDFLKKKPEVLKRILNQAKAPLRDAAAVNATRWKLKEVLETLGLPVELGSGGLTKFNRKKLDIPKTHWTDAACVGQSTPNSLNVAGYQPLIIKAMGRGSRQMVKPDKFGFPRTSPRLRQKIFYGFMTGDIVKAVLPKGKNAGTHIGRVSVRRTGSFDIKSPVGMVSANYKRCQFLQRSDGYAYSFGKIITSHSRPKPSLKIC